MDTTMFHIQFLLWACLITENGFKHFVLGQDTVFFNGFFSYHYQNATCCGNLISDQQSQQAMVENQLIHLVLHNLGVQHKVT